MTSESNPWKNSTQPSHSSVVERWAQIKPLVELKLPSCRTFDGGRSVLNLTGFIEKGDCLGGGSYGDVYKAHLINTLPEEKNPFKAIPTMAVKVMRVASVGDEQMRMKRLKSLLKEIEIGTSLNHHNILPVVGVATMEKNMNHPSLVTLWISNGTVMQYLNSHPEVERLPIIVGVTDGLAYLHSRNPQVIHGDMKPDNVLIDERGNPLLCDFGLSRIMSDATLWKTSATHAGGTLRFLAPELMKGLQPTVNEAGDVYAYAMTSYEIMTGNVPFHEFPRDTTIMDVVLLKKSQPTRPSSDNAIISVLWRLWIECWKWTPQQRITIDRVQNVVHGISRRKGDSSLKGNESCNPAPSLLPIHLNSMIVSGSVDCSLRVWDPRLERLVMTFIGHESDVNSVVFSPDGKRLYSGSRDRSVRIWDTEKGIQLKCIDFQQEIWFIAISPGGKFLACAGTSWQIAILDASAGELSRSLSGHNGSIRALDFSSSGEFLVSGSDDQTLRLWKADTGEVLRIFEGHGGFVTSVAFSPLGSWISSGSLDGSVRIWVLKSGRCQHRLVTSTKVKSNVRCVNWSPDGSIIGAGLDNGVVPIWNPVTGDKVRCYSGHSESVRAIQFSPDGRHMVSASYDKTIRVWDLGPEARLISCLTEHTEPINTLSFWMRLSEDDKSRRHSRETADPHQWGLGGFGVLNRRAQQKRKSKK